MTRRGRGDADLGGVEEGVDGAAITTVIDGAVGDGRGWGGVGVGRQVFEVVGGQVRGLPARVRGLHSSTFHLSVSAFRTHKHVHKHVDSDENGLS